MGAAVMRWTVDIMLRSDDTNGFQVLPKRWIVVRTFAWLLNARRLSKDYEFTLRSLRLENSNALFRKPVLY